MTELNKQFRVLIPTAGTGSRLGDFTKYINKSLVSVSNKPMLCYLIDQFPNNYEFVIALGYKGKLVKDFLELAYPHKNFFFATVDIFEGEGSGLGRSLLSCEKFLQQPFIFLSCDTLIKGKIPEPNHNWMGYAETDDLLKYRTLSIEKNRVYKVNEKGIIKENIQPYIGIAGIYDYKIFWNNMRSGGEIAINQGESFAMNAIIESKSVNAYQFKWFDTGNITGLSKARREYAQKNEPNILEKSDEAIWFVGKDVIKYSNDTSFIANRVKRAKELKGFVPRISLHKPNMYSYKKVHGEVLSEVIDLYIFEDFLRKCKEFWIECKLTNFNQNKFQNNCMSFYKDKTINRVNLFYKNFNLMDNASFINGQKIPPLTALIDKIDWSWISKGLPGRFHGDFHFENILYQEKDKSFVFLDWRQDFAGDLSIGDIYYDLAKLMHGLIMNHGIIAKNYYTATWENNHLNYDFFRKQILIECEKMFCQWIRDNNYDLKKVNILTGLIFLNIAPLHHYPYSILLYGLGKNILHCELI